MWSVERIADYLGDWGVSVVRKGDTFSLHPPESLHREAFEHVAEVARSHIAPQRAAFVKYVEGAGDNATPLYRNLPPAEKRRHDFRRIMTRADLLQELFGWACRPCWSSQYDASTGWLTREHKAFPPHATLANVVVDVPGWVADSPGGVDTGQTVPYTWAITDRFGKPLVAGREGPRGRWLAFDPRTWVPLPHSRPPAGFKGSADFIPPPDWQPPPGWWDREAKWREAKRQAERREWFRRNWGSESLPPD